MVNISGAAAVNKQRSCSGGEAASGDDDDGASKAGGWLEGSLGRLCSHLQLELRLNTNKHLSIPSHCNRSAV